MNHLSNHSTQNLTIKYLIDLLNDHTNLKIDRHQLLIDSYPTLKIESIISYDNLLTTLLIAYKNIKYEINNLTLKISISNEILKTHKQSIQKFIYDSTIDQSKKKKYIGFITNQNGSTIYPTNESILVLTYYFGINLMIYNTESQTIKCYYWDNNLDKEQPFIIIKETKDTNSPNLYYELVFSQNKFMFDFNHPIIIELIGRAFFVGLEQNKKLEYIESNKISDIMISNLDESNLTESNLTESNLTESNLTESNSKIIKLNLIPKRIIKIIDELQTSNFVPI
jgi:hypothetical protein